MMWAGNAVVGRMMVGTMPPVAMNALRWLLVGVMLWPLVRRNGLDWGDVRARWGYLACIGVLGVGTYNALQYLALLTSSPLSVTLIGSSVPVWMMLVGRIGFGQALRPRQLAGAALSVCGVMLVMTRGDLSVLGQLRLVPGDLLMLVASLAGQARFYRTLFLEEAGKDYVRTARAKGLKETTVLTRHVLRNAMLPIITSAGAALPYLFMGGLVTESFFGIPGLGSYTIDAINGQDFAVVRTMVFLGSLLYILSNILIDVAYTWADPRVRMQ